MISDLPPLNALRAFASAARHQSFSRAAEELHVTHSAVSRHIRLLEEHLGIMLFERRNRQSVLTPSGQAYYEQISLGLAQIANATQALARSSASRKVIINVRPSFAVRWLIPRLPEFMTQFPEIQPEIVTSILAPDPSREAFDLVVRRGSAGWAANLEPNMLFEDELLLGDLEARRDWGYAGDSVRAMWLMLQQETPSDYVIATGESHSVRELVELAFAHVDLDWHDHVRVDPALVRGSAELHDLVGDASRARRELGWRPEVSFEQLVRLLVDADVERLRTQSSSTMSRIPGG